VVGKAILTLKARAVWWEFWKEGLVPRLRYGYFVGSTRSDFVNVIVGGKNTQAPDI
jgi:hypothetical protein